MEQAELLKTELDMSLHGDISHNPFFDSTREVLLQSKGRWWNQIYCQCSWTRLGRFHAGVEFCSQHYQIISHHKNTIWAWYGYKPRIPKSKLDATALLHCLAIEQLLLLKTALDQVQLESLMDSSSPSDPTKSHVVRKIIQQKRLDRTRQKLCKFCPTKSAFN